MKRLCETTNDGNATLGRAAVLLRTTAPLGASEVRKARVRAAIRARGGVKRRTSRWRLSPLAAGIALALGGGAFAAWVATNVGGVKRIETRPASNETPHKVRIVANAGDANETPVFLLVPDSVSTVASERPPQAAQRAMPQSGASRKARRHTVSRPFESEAELVASALTAQRDAKDGRRAIALVRRHLERFPTGALGEEALLIGIEAATTTGDDKSLRRFAESYLARFPEGRWAASVRALGTESPRD